jgi:hypothetical protein
MAEKHRYEVRVQGWIGERWLSWFDDMALVCEGTQKDSPSTRLISPPLDQAALRGLLTKLWDLNLTLLFVSRLEDAANQTGSQQEGERSNE